MSSAFVVRLEGGVFIRAMTVVLQLVHFIKVLREDCSVFWGVCHRFVRLFGSCGSLLEFSVLHCIDIASICDLSTLKRYGTLNEGPDTYQHVNYTYQHTITRDDRGCHKIL